MTCCKMACCRHIVNTEIKHEVRLWKKRKAAGTPFDNNVARMSMVSAVGTHIFIIIYISNAFSLSLIMSLVKMAPD